jgi:hypothetical protein
MSKQVKVGDKIWIHTKDDFWNEDGEMDYLLHTIQEVAEIAEHGEVGVRSTNSDYDRWWLLPTHHIVLSDDVMQVLIEELSP